VAIISGGIVILGALAMPIVRLVFGSQFADASVILQIMCVGLILTVLAYPVNATLFALNKSAVFPIMSAVSVAVFLLSNVVLIPRLGAVGAAIAFSLSAGVALLVSFIFYFIFAKANSKTGLAKSG
jgi:O-antigen/teichoic acid export membrane protein